MSLERPFFVQNRSKLAPAATPSEKSKRGRPATGKRSDDPWIGRTYYVKRSTDLDVEEELLKLKRRGVEIDKSELVDFLMSVWVKWQQGENIRHYSGKYQLRSLYQGSLCRNGKIVHARNWVNHDLSKRMWGIAYPKSLW